MAPDFSIPEAFIALSKDGRLDYWGAPYHTLSDAQRAALARERVSQVLWWRSIEWDRTIEDVLTWTGDDVLRPGLVPFAGNGYGDQYCWYLPWQGAAPEPPVVFFVYDEKESHLFARSFAECLCRCMLEHFASGAEDDDDGDEQDLLALWASHFEIIKPWLDGEQRAFLSSVRRKEACVDALATLERQVGTRRLVGRQLPTSYAEDVLSEDHLLRLYDESVDFYREIVEGEGREAFRARLDEAERNRQRLAKYLARRA